MLPKGGDVVGMLGTLLGSRGRRLTHIQGSPPLGEVDGDLRAAMAAVQGRPGLTGLAPSHAPGSPLPPTSPHSPFSGPLPSGPRTASCS